MKSGGLFLPIDNQLQVSEFTPRNLYELQIYNSSASFQGISCYQNDNNGICQFMGDYIMNYPGFNNIAMYKHMNNHCPSHPLEYHRTIHC